MGMDMDISRGKIGLVFMKVLFCSIVKAPLSNVIFPRRSMGRFRVLPQKKVIGQKPYDFTLKII